MSELTVVPLLGLKEGGALEGGDGGYLDVSAHDGNVYRFTFQHDAIYEIIRKLDQVAGVIHQERTMTGKSASRDATRMKKIEGHKYGVEEIHQVVVITTVFVDKTLQDTAVAKRDIPGLVQFLNKALARFEAQDTSRPH